MTGGYKLTTEDLNQHARDLMVFADNVRQAKGTASDPMAYGAIGAVWGVATNHMNDDARNFADKAAAAAERVAQELLAMANSYEQQEQDTATTLRQAGGDTP